MIKTFTLAAALLAATGPAALAAKPVPVPNDVCADMRRHMTEKPAAPAPGAQRPLSPEAKRMLAGLTGAGQGGSAAPNAQAQAILNMMAGALAARGDAASQASAAYMRSMGAKPGSNPAADLKALGC